MDRYNDDLRFIKQIKRLKIRELLHLVLDKSIRRTEELEMKDVWDLLIRYDNMIEEYFRTYTRNEFIHFLQDEDEQSCVLLNIQDIFKTKMSPEWCKW